MFKKLLGFALLAASIAFVAPARATDISLDGFLRGQCSTASATSGAATLNNKCGVITSEALTSPAGSVYTLTLTNSTVAAADIVLWTVENGTNTTGLSIQTAAGAAAGSVTFAVRQATATAYNGTLKIKYFVIKP